MHGERLSPAWNDAFMRLGLAWGIMLGLFARDWMAMADQWWNSSTYTHILLVPAIIGWLAWQRWDEAKDLTPQCWAPGLWALGGAALVWALGTLAGFAEVSQAGTVGMAMACVPLLMGPHVTAAFLFPVAYMAFLVPFGDEIIPLLQTITARLTILFVHLSHIPAQIDGVFIATPAGLFEVAEACSGVKFLVAMIAFGALAANVCFRSWPRRAVFMAVCVVVPIIANGIRAWGTVYAAQIKGAAWAGGFDHIIYGWFFFAAVIAAIIGLGWRWFDRAVTDPMIDGAAIAADPRLAQWSRAGIAPGRAATGMAAILAVAFAWTFAADRMLAPLPAAIAPPQVAGWQLVPTRQALPWQPRATGAERRFLATYQDGQGRRVEVFVALYASQGPGKKAGGFGEGALTPASGWAWQGEGPARADAKSDRLLATGPLGRLAETTYRTGDLTTGSNLRLKLANIRDRVLLRRRPTMMLILSAQEDRGWGPDRPADHDSAAEAINGFRGAIGPVGPWMDRIAGR